MAIWPDLHVYVSVDSLLILHFLELFNFYKMSSSTVVSNVITLRCSTDIVTEFFNYSVNNILYQRGVYPPESFKRVSQYGLSMMVTTDEGLLSYLSNILRQLDGNLTICAKNNIWWDTSNYNSMTEWLLNKSVQKLILVIKDIESKETSTKM